MTESNSILRTFEEHDRTVYVHAYRSVMNDWRLGLTIVAAHDGERTTTRTPDAWQGQGLRERRSRGTRGAATRPRQVGPASLVPALPLHYPTLSHD
jgi:hypothetical protein